MLAQRLRSWPNITPPLGERHVYAGCGVWRVVRSPQTMPGAWGRPGRRPSTRLRDTPQSYWYLLHFSLWG